MIPQVILGETGDLGSTQRRAYSLEVAGKPLAEIPDYLDVEHSARYQPDAHSTYCNIYAHDFCRQAGVFLPRVWWTSAALAGFSGGESKATIKYADTVFEMNANGLHNWMGEYGQQFGWSKVYNAADLQTAANSGAVCCITGRRLDRKLSGHIAMVVAATPDLQPGLGPFRPIQSQAGSVNFKRRTAGRWWEQSKFDAYGFWAVKSK